MKSKTIKLPLLVATSFVCNSFDWSLSIDDNDQQYVRERQVQPTIKRHDSQISTPHIFATIYGNSN